MVTDQEEEIDDKVALTKGQYQQLLNVLQHRDSLATIHSAYQTQSIFNPVPYEPKGSKMSGISFCLLTYTHKSYVLEDIPWIIDTGATDHMVCNTSLPMI